MLNLELTESLKERIRGVCLKWCPSKGATSEEEPPLAAVEYAKLLLALGFELPNTLEDGEQLGANARQRRTIRRSRERAIKAIEELHK